jgi:penicillin amidase
LLLRKLLILVFVLCLIVVSVAIGALLWARSELTRALPRISGTVTLDGLSEQVEIYRDEYGIPHIYAQNREDLMFAVGFVCAQDRLWQMDLTRRAATGRLAELFGERAIEIDLLARTIAFEHIAKQQTALLSPEHAAMLDAFSRGVNTGTKRLDALPPECRLLGYTPEPWQSSDSMAISRLLAWQLSMNFKTEIVMARLAAKLGASRAAELNSTYPPQGPFIISGWTSDAPGEIIEEPIDTADIEKGARLLEEIMGTPGGSNSWVMGPSLTRTGAPILANDPHLSGTRMPSIWYFMHLCGGGFDIIGGVAPGVPLPLLGHNRHIGWGVTNMTADVQDLYIERLDPADPNRYEYDGQWLDMETRVERIAFRTGRKEQSFVEKEIRSTIHGPIVNSLAPGVTQAISLRWTGFEPTLDLAGIVGINLAKNWDEFHGALSSFRVAPQNFIYADIDGNIGYQGAGMLPIRSSGNGATPQAGWTSATAWNGWAPYEEMPYLFNPPEGYIVNANNRTVGDEYEHLISTYWAPRYRYARIAELIESGAPHTVADNAQMQMDAKSLLAELILTDLLPALNERREPMLDDALNLLKEWDFVNTTDSVAATVYHEFFIRLATNTFKDELGEELTKEYLGDYYLWIERFVQLLHEDSPWFDDIRTDEVETRDDIALLSLREAVTALRQRFESDMNAWQWGRVHRIEFRHPLGLNRFAKKLLNIGPFPFPGDGESVNRGTFDFNQPYDVSMAASIRHIMDFSNLDSTLGIHTTGQSGNPLSPHYRDFAGAWLEGDCIALMMDREDFASNAEGYLRLVPARTPVSGQ